MDQDWNGRAWEDRIRERAWRYATRSAGGSPQDHWLQAKDDLWRETLATATALAERLNRMRAGLDEGTNEGLRAAVEVGCEAMQFLFERTDFAEQVRARAGRPPFPLWSREGKAYADDVGLFEDFIAVERRILVTSGLDPVLADQICRLLREKVDLLRRGEAHAEDAVRLLNIAVFRTCRARETIRAASLARTEPEAMPWYRRSARGILTALGGGLVVVSDAAASAMVYEGLGEFSKEFGCVLFGWGLEQMH